MEKQLPFPGLPEAEIVTFSRIRIALASASPIPKLPSAACFPR